VLLRSIRLVAGEEAGDADEQHRADGGRGKAAEEAIGHDAEAGEDPSANHSANKSQDGIANAAEAASAKQVAGNPAGKQAGKM
jgi:hypothetical protein